MLWLGGVVAKIEKSLTGVVKHLLANGWTYEDVEQVLGKRQTVIERHIPVPQPYWSNPYTFPPLIRWNNISSSNQPTLNRSAKDE